jgi:hypothetical protein
LAVNLNFKNFKIESQYNFETRLFGADTLGFPYDYYSTMHYEWNAFSKNGMATIEPYDSNVKLLPTAEKTSLSAIDVQELRAYYECS